jgi:hypothetical protein
MAALVKFNSEVFGVLSYRDDMVENRGPGLSIHLTASRDLGKNVYYDHVTREFEKGGMANSWHHPIHVEETKTWNIATRRVGNLVDGMHHVDSKICYWSGTNMRFHGRHMCRGYSGLYTKVFRTGSDAGHRWIEVLISGNRNVNCGVTYGHWSNKAQQCGTRSTYVTRPSSGAGNKCPATATQTRGCTVNCAGRWGDWSVKASACGQRSYIVTQSPKGSGTKCPSPTTQTTECKSSIGLGPPTVRFGDRIIISTGSQVTRTQNCGLYGCRVGQMSGPDNYFGFNHGKENPRAFYVRPWSHNKKNRDCVSYGNRVVIAASPEPGWTSNCGYFGCGKLIKHSVFKHNGGEASCFGAAKAEYGTKVTQKRNYLVRGSWASIPPGCSVEIGKDWAAHWNRNANGKRNDRKFREVGLEKYLVYVRPPPTARSQNMDGKCVKFGDAFALAFTGDNHDTGDCGWYGCTTLRVDNGKRRAVIGKHGGKGSKPTTLYMLQPPVMYGNSIVISADSKDTGMTGCGLFGCRVLRVTDKSLGFGHGGSNPSQFFIRPQPGGPRSNGECVRFNDQIAIAQTPELSNGCGTYGCRVLNTLDHGRIAGNRKTPTMDHGGKAPETFYLRSREGHGGQCIKLGDAFVLSSTDNACRGNSCGGCGEFGCRKLKIAADGLSAEFNHRGMNSAADQLYMLWRGD